MKEKFVAILMDKMVLGQNKYVFKPLIAMMGRYNLEEDVFIDNYYKPYYNIETANILIDESDSLFGFPIEISKLMETYKTEFLEEAIGNYFDDICNFIYIGIADSKGILKIVKILYDELLNVQYENQQTSEEVSSDDLSVAIYFLEPELRQLVETKSGEEIKLYLKNVLATYNERKEEILKMATDGKNCFDLNEMVKNELEEESNVLSTNKPLEELNSLIGLEKIKNEVIKLKDFLTFLNKVKENALIKVPNLNMTFVGNPGTGKTTVARIITNILYDLKYIKNNSFIEVTTGDFIGRYVGHTGPKTKELISLNKGGVIFIDEAYSFTSKGQSFAQEALVEILKEMETGETIFIFAGYKEQMQEFIDMNPGLKSRLGYNLIFDDYSLEQLYEIFVRKVNLSKLKLEPSMEIKIKEIINHYKDSENFGNARFINNLFDKLLLEHASKVLNEDDIDALLTLNLSDTESIYDNLDVKTKKISMIGFKGGTK